MHGRLKVKTSAEQAEAKRLEREKKLKVFKNAMKIAFHKREAGENDDECLRATGGVLSANPDIYTLWNIRREIYNHLAKERSSEDMQTLFTDELQFIVACLQVNPKSYGCWQQRMWVLTNMPSPDWNNELSLCNKFLEYDDRNFHCWDYRRFIVTKADVSAEQELEFTTKKIATNFSNYSSWHYRSKLLLKLHGRNEVTGVHGDAQSGHSRQVLKEDALLKEFTIVQNAFFTDPDDQSAWFYQRWLLGKGERDLEIRQAAYSLTSRTLVVAFTHHISMTDKELHVNVRIDGVRVDGQWHNAAFNPSNQTSDVTSQYCPVWVFTHDPVATVTRVDATLERRGTVVSRCEVLVDGADGFVMSPATCDDTEFKMGVTAATNAILTSELDSCIQLHQLEPQNKWALLTVVLLMRTLDYDLYEPDITSHLKRLEELDTKRRAYYRDLGSRFITENVLSCNKHVDRLDLSGKHLTALYHPSHMTFCREIDLSNNHLASTRYFYLFQLVEKLNLDDNEISRLEDFCLPRLTELSLKNNHIREMTDLSPLKNCPLLTSVNLADNALCEGTSDYRSLLHSVVSALVTVDGCITVR